MGTITSAMSEAATVPQTMVLGHLVPNTGILQTIVSGYFWSPPRLGLATRMEDTCIREFESPFKQPK